MLNFVVIKVGAGMVFKFSTSKFLFKTLLTTHCHLVDVHWREKLRRWSGEKREMKGQTAAQTSVAIRVLVLAEDDVVDRHFDVILAENASDLRVSDVLERAVLATVLIVLAHSFCLSLLFFSQRTLWSSIKLHLVKFSLEILDFLKKNPRILL